MVVLSCLYVCATWMQLPPSIESTLTRAALIVQTLLADCVYMTAMI